MAFETDEFAERLARTRRAMAERRLDALLLFAPESAYWLTGHEAVGAPSFQCLVVPAEGRHDDLMVLLTEPTERRRAKAGAAIDDVRAWSDGDAADPTGDLEEILREKDLIGATLGVEIDTAGLTAAMDRKLDARLGDACPLVDASDLVSVLRLVKSPAEIAHLRKAGEISDACLEAAGPHIGVGADLAFIRAAMMGELLARGGDAPAQPFHVSAATPGDAAPAQPRARLLRGGDQLTLDWAGVWRRYHAAQLRTVAVGPMDDGQKRLFAAARDALIAAEDALRPGAALSEAHAALFRTLDAAGVSASRREGGGAAMGARFAPSWFERERVAAGSSLTVRPGMVIHLRAALTDDRSGAAMALGRTSLVGDQGAEPLSALPLEPLES